jgi:hypothetical protein
MPISGGCLCGQLRYEIASEKPIVARVCWCRVCQYLGAGLGTANALFEKAALNATGERATFTSQADSGATMFRSFCPKCGTPVFSEAEPRPDFIIVRVGTLDDPEIGKPVGTIWTSSAPSWACIDEDLPKGARGTLPTS